ncbi:MAG: hypothetical protein GY856_18950, partial [bacterium]|nr:hypothetical protein [bacterium]
AIRWYPRSETHQITVFPRDRNNNCYLCQAIKVEGFSGATPGRNLEIAPTVTAVRTATRHDFPHGEIEDDDGDTEAGITARWGITPNLTLGTTINPDFSQVEADALQLDINEPFALFFAEKRPFFMEAADFFNTRFDAVYTRTLRDPSWGMALTGKEGADTIGAYVVRDDVTNLIFPGNESSSGTSLKMASTAAVARYKRDIGDRYTLGLLVTNREGDRYANRVAGVDGDLRLTPKDRIRFQLLGSSTEYPAEVAAEFNQPLDDLTDWAADLHYSHDTRTYAFWGGYRDVGAEFRADLGFMPRVDYRRYYAGSGYHWNAKEDSWYSRLTLSGEYQYDVDQAGDLLNREAELNFTYEGPPLQSHSVIGLETSRQAYNGVEFDLSSLSLHQCMNPNGHSHVWFNVDLGDRIDYANTRLGERVRLHPGLTYRLGRHLRFELWHTFERMEVESERLYTANISQLTLAYHFSARTFLRSIVQNVDYEYNTALYGADRDSEHQRVFTQLLFSYKVNPQTVVFVGYSDNHLGNQDVDLTRSDRTFFAKIGYAWTP